MGTRKTDTWTAFQQMDGSSSCLMLADYLLVLKPSCSCVCHMEVFSCTLAGWSPWVTCIGCNSRIPAVVILLTSIKLVAKHTSATSRLKILAFLSCRPCKPYSSSVFARLLPMWSANILLSRLLAATMQSLKCISDQYS